MKTILLFFVTTSLLTTLSANQSLVQPTYKLHTSFEPGKIGKALAFNKQTKLKYNTQYIKANSGTIEVWLKAQNPGPKEVEHLFSVGTNNPLWFLVSLDSKSIIFSYIEKGQKGFKYYASIKHQISLSKKSWFHLALVWAYKKPGECLMQLYINGKLVEEKFNLTTGSKWHEQNKALGIGFSTASFSAPSFKGLMDELRISNYPKTPSTIKAAYEKVNKSNPLELEKGTLLLLHFDDNLDGHSSTTDELTQSDLNHKYEIILDELYP